ncbi:hypothetical protein KC19_2G076400 [Ceratodon purpureus]|uniref:Uncharacterized protein n=1 Tax=Ceratodon purpureus TaxID=3225 RepID=A0A8T0IUB3_CERPU|nr:hypothetical protein KC19_2G076400 [Ceratodon purpureus]
MALRSSPPYFVVICSCSPTPPPTSSHFHHLHRESTFPVPATPKDDTGLTDHIQCPRNGTHSDISPLCPSPRLSNLKVPKPTEQRKKGTASRLPAVPASEWVCNILSCQAQISVFLGS